MIFINSFFGSTGIKYFYDSFERYSDTGVNIQVFESGFHISRNRKINYRITTGRSFFVDSYWYDSFESYDAGDISTFKSGVQFSALGITTGVSTGYIISNRDSYFFDHFESYDPTTIVSLDSGRHSGDGSLRIGFFFSP